jgi:hypothetical protein
MCVQPKAFGRKVIQYIVLYCLTPPLFDRYSWLNLWSALPAWDGIEQNAHFAEGKGISLVNRPVRPNHWQLATDNWQLFFPRSSRCLN